jgi:hypothetical protein
MTLLTVGLDALTLRGERDLAHIALYRSLKRMLVDDGVRFRVPGPRSPHGFWDRALFLNLTYWDARDPRDVLVDASLDADVLAHVAWHHAARKALGGPVSADALFLGESVASAFDLYLVGRTLAHTAPRGHRGVAPSSRHRARQRLPAAVVKHPVPAAQSVPRRHGPPAGTGPLTKHSVRYVSAPQGTVGGSMKGRQVYPLAHARGAKASQR